MNATYGENKFGRMSELYLRAAQRDGKTILEDVHFTAPFKIMTPFQKIDGGIEVMPLCASAGIMKGDVQKLEYYVCEGADVEVLSQAFEKIHRMDGGSARREINVTVEKNAKMSYYPQPVIPFAGSAFQSDMVVHLADKSSKFFLVDILSCGRSAQGEKFEYRRFSSKVKIYRGDELIYRDNALYEPDKMSMEDIGMYEGFTHLANVFLSAGDKQIQDQLYEIMQNEHDCEFGVTKLAKGDLAVRILGRRAQKLQDITEKIQSCFFTNTL